MLRHPSENFIKYLMVCGHPQSNNDNWIIMSLESLGFPRPEASYLVALRSDLLSSIPDDFQTNNQYNRKSIKFMKSQGIHDLFFPNKASKEAQLIVTNLRIRPLVENLLLGRMDSKEIAKKINAKFASFLTAEIVEAYKHYYWQVSLLTVEDWSKLLEEYEIQRQNTLAIVQVGPSMALHKLGFQQSIDSKTILKNMQETLYFDFQEWKSKPHGLERTKAMSAIARTLVTVDVQMSQADSALKDSLKAFEQFRMEHAKASVQDIRELAPDGNYSGSGARLIESPIKEPINE